MVIISLVQEEIRDNVRPYIQSVEILKRSNVLKDGDKFWEEKR